VSSVWFETAGLGGRTFEIEYDSNPNHHSSGKKNLGKKNTAEKKGMFSFSSNVSELRGKISKRYAKLFISCLKYPRCSTRKNIFRDHLSPNYHHYRQTFGFGGFFQRVFGINRLAFDCL